MKKNNYLVLILTSILLLSTAKNANAQDYYTNYNLCQKRIIAYFASWGDRPDKGNYGVDDIPWDKLTHINYAFAKVGTNYKIEIMDPAVSINAVLPGQDASLSYKGQFNLLTVYKKKYPGVKTLISIGGWAASGGFYDMTANANRRETFGNSCIEFLKKYSFDGIDLDFEYPSNAGGAVLPCDEKMYGATYGSVIYANYTALLKRLREKLDSASNADNKKYLMTIAATASHWTLTGMGDQLSTYVKYLDYINIMSYDLHGAWNRFVGPHNALYASTADTETNGMDQPVLNCDWIVKYYSGIIHPSRINLGVGYYSRGWDNVTGGTNGLWGSTTFSSMNVTCPDGSTTSQNIGDGAAGIDGIWDDPAPEPDAGANPLWHVLNLLKNPGSANYNYLQGTPYQNMQSGITGYNRFFDNTTKSVYVWNASKKTFLTYEDTVSLKEKLDYIVSRGLGGMMFWELSGDYHYDSQLGYYTNGSDMTNYARKYFNNATLVHATGRTGLPAPSNSFSYSYTGTYVNPNYTPHFIITNKSSSTIPGGWIVEFDLPKSARYEKTDGTGTLSVIDNTHPLWTRYRIVGPSWQTIAPNGTVDITGNIKLVAAGGPLNVVFQGSTSQDEYKMMPDVTCSTVSIANLNNQALTGAAVYPNPGKDVFYFQNPITENTQLSVYDVKGVLVYKQQLSVGETRLKLNYLAEGVYVIKYESNKGVNFQKLVIQ